MQVRILRQEAEIRQRIDFGPRVPVFIKPCLGEDVMHFQTRHPAEHVRLERQAGAPVASLTHPGQHVEDRIEPRSEAPAGEVAGLDPETALREPKLLDQRIEAPVRSLERRQVLIDHRFGRGREAPPHAGLGEPEQQPVPLPRVEAVTPAVQVAGHHGNRETAEEHPVVIETEATGDQVEAGVDVLARAVQSRRISGASLSCR